MKFVQVDEKTSLPGARYIDLDKVTGIAIDVKTEPSEQLPKQVVKRVVIRLSVAESVDTATFETVDEADNWLSENFNITDLARWCE